MRMLSNAPWDDVHCMFFKSGEALCPSPHCVLRILWKEVSLWQRTRCFPSMPRRRKLNMEQSPVILDLRLRKTQAGNSHDCFNGTQTSFSWSSVLKMFSVNTKTQSRHFQISFRFEERFRKAPFSWRISVDCRQSVGIKLCFRISRPLCGQGVGAF